MGVVGGGDAGLRWLADLRRDVDRYARALGVAAPGDVAGTLDYLVACSLLEERDGRFRLNPGARLPAEVLPLSRARVAEEDAGRWLDLFGPVVRRLVGLFGAAGDDPLDEVRMTLRGLADILELDVETVRAAVAILGDRPDFTVLGEVERACPHDEVRIRVNGPVRLNPLEPT
ncbi:DUF6042 family protein [Actinokineospora sp. G85]|uniref:DUF6042 family protein n=1 Tax=Actinokineospora sp. G85 TaxID=3406626 RepID=UPI003C77FB06